MGEQVAWQVELAVKPGALEDFRALTGEMVAATRGEPGVLSYERFVSADGMVVHVDERYYEACKVTPYAVCRATSRDEINRLILSRGIQGCAAP